MKENNIKFQKYDYGKAENQIKYKKDIPDEYDLSKLAGYDFEVNMVVGLNDLMADTNDIALLSSMLDQSKSTVDYIPGYSHISWFMPRDPKPIFDVLDRHLGIKKN